MIRRIHGPGKLLRTGSNRGTAEPRAAANPSALSAADRAATLRDGFVGRTVHFANVVGPIPLEDGGSTAFTKPEVIAVDSPNNNERDGMDIDTIVIHHTESADVESALAQLTSPGTDVSAHYVIDVDGTIYQLVGDEKRAWHAGESELHGVPTDVNGRSIGIEIVNDGSGTMPFTDEQYEALIQLTGYLQQEYDVPTENIVGHKDVAVPYGRKTDPAENFDWDRLLSALPE